MGCRWTRSVRLANVRSSEFSSAQATARREQAQAADKALGDVFKAAQRPAQRDQDAVDIDGSLGLLLRFKVVGKLFQDALRGDAVAVDFGGVPIIAEDKQIRIGVEVDAQKDGELIVDQGPLIRTHGRAPGGGAR